jgi:signal transduction histidine kinase/CheY-like chemotaxis protein
MINRSLLLIIKRRLPRNRRNSFDIYYVFFSVSSLIFLVPMAPLLYALGLGDVALSVFWACLFVFIALVLWFKGMPRLWALSIYQTSIMGIILFNAWHLGGVTSPVMVWLGIVPVLPLFTFKSRNGVYFWLSVSMLSVLLTFVLQLMGFFPIQANQTWQDLALGAMMYGLLVYTQWSLIRSVDLMNQQSVKHINRTNLRLKKLSHDLTEANAHKDRILAIVSHEMRTPLNAVMGYLSLMSTDQRMTSDLQEFVSGAQNSAAHLLTVINDLLDYSQIQNGKITLNPQVFNLHTMLQKTHATLSPRAADLGLSYQLFIEDSVPVWVKADQHRLTQILINLLGNALKFTDKGHVHTYVSFETHNSLAMQGMLRVCVEDTGPGIDTAQQIRIFEPFVQLAHANSRSARDALRGNGLGLSITNTLVQSHGGRIELQSTVGKGSSFIVKVPLLLAPAAPKTDPVLERIDSRVVHLLIVDDHAVNRLVAKATILRALPNAVIDEAEDGTSGLAQMSKTLYDLVLLDLVMPDMDGIEVMRRVRNDLAAPFNKVQVIALTANVASDALKACHDVGINEVMPKPFDRHTLVNRIMHYCLPEDKPASS